MVRPREGEPQILNDELMLRLMDEGLSMAEIARKFNITRQAVYQRKRKLGKFVSRQAVVQHGGEIVQRELDFGQQLLKVAYEADRLLDKLKDRTDRESQELTIRALAEIRAQVQAWHVIRRDLFTMKEMVEVFNQIMDVIEGVDHDVRLEILRRLRARGFISGVFQISQ